MAQRDRSWRRHHTRTAEARHQTHEGLHVVPGGLDEATHPARPNAAQKARVWWRTEQERREAA